MTQRSWFIIFDYVTIIQSAINPKIVKIDVKYFDIFFRKFCKLQLQYLIIFHQNQYFRSYGHVYNSEIIIFKFLLNEYYLKCYNFVNNKNIPKVQKYFL